MISYDWNVIAKEQKAIRDLIEQDDLSMKISIQINENLQLLMRTAAYLSRSSHIANISTISDPYFLGAYLFTLGIMIDSNENLSLGDFIPYMADHIGNSFDTSFIDNILQRTNTTALPLMSGIVSEYTSLELILSTEHHAVKLAKLILCGAITGFAIRRIAMNDDGTPKSWFYEYQEYISKVYTEVMQGRNNLLN